MFSRSHLNQAAQLAGVAHYALRISLSHASPDKWLRLLSDSSQPHSSEIRLYGGLLCLLHLNDAKNPDRSDLEAIFEFVRAAANHADKFRRVRELLTRLRQQHKIPTSKIAGYLCFPQNTSRKFLRQQKSSAPSASLPASLVVQAGA